MKKIAAYFIITGLALFNYSASIANNTKVQPIKVGLSVSGIPTQQVTPAWNSIIKALGRATGAPVSLVYYKNKKKLIDDIAAGNIGIAYLKVVTERHAMKKSADVKPISVAVTIDSKTKRERTTYTGVVVVANNSSINNLKELNHKTIAYYDKYSSSNYVLIKQKLDELGLQVHWLKLASLDASYSAILKNKAQATGTWDYAHNVQLKKDHLKIIATFPNIQNPVLVINTKVISPEQKHQIQTALMHVKAHGNIVGFKPLS